MNPRILFDWCTADDSFHFPCRSNDYGTFVEIVTSNIFPTKPTYYAYFPFTTLKSIEREHPEFAEKIKPIKEREDFFTIEEAKQYIDGKLKSIGCVLITNKTKVML